MDKMGLAEKREIKEPSVNKVLTVQIVTMLISVIVLHGGMFGMAMATTLSYWITLAYNYLCFFRRSSYRVIFQRGIRRNNEGHIPFRHALSYL